MPSRLKITTETESVSHNIYHLHRKLEQMINHAAYALKRRIHKVDHAQIIWYYVLPLQPSSKD